MAIWFFKVTNYFCVIELNVSTLSSGSVNTRICVVLVAPYKISYNIHLYIQSPAVVRVCQVAVILGGSHAEIEGIMPI
jgi:hypothetical protein